MTRWRGNYHIKILWYQVQSYWMQDGPRTWPDEEGITRSWDYGTVPWDHELLHLHIKSVRKDCLTKTTASVMTLVWETCMFFVAKGSPTYVFDCFPQNIFPTLAHIMRSQYTLDQGVVSALSWLQLDEGIEYVHF